jgi:phosphonopyruvate decarboxylase
METEALPVKIPPRDLYDALSSAGVDFWAGVPDSLLKHFCAFVTDSVSADKHIITANEGSAVALASGHFMATGSVPLVYCQNSGLGNIVNPLLSLVDPLVYSIPMVLMVGWRGRPGEKDEPQHRKQGEVMFDMLQAMGVPSYLLDSRDTADVNIARAVDTVSEAKRRQGPVALVIPKGLFSTHKLSLEMPQMASLSREAAIEKLVSLLEPTDIVVATTGMIARELFEVRERRGEGHDRDFLTVGSMGHCSQIALGIALARPDRRVICVDGDGAVLMHMGGIATIGAQGPRNLLHLILNNAAHDSVGGQPTVADRIDLPGLFTASGYVYANVAGEVESDLRIFLAQDGPAMLEVRVARGAREDLGRPTSSPIENRHALMGNLSE